MTGRLLLSLLGCVVVGGQSVKRTTHICLSEAVASSHYLFLGNVYKVSYVSLSYTNSQRLKTFNATKSRSFCVKTHASDELSVESRARHRVFVVIISIYTVSAFMFVSDWEHVGLYVMTHVQLQCSWWSCCMLFVCTVWHCSHCHVLTDVRRLSGSSHQGQCLSLCVSLSVCACVSLCAYVFYYNYLLNRPTYERHNNDWRAASGGLKLQCIVIAIFSSFTFLRVWRIATVHVVTNDRYFIAKFT